MEKKLRSFLILLAIALSTALFFASNAVSTSFSDTIIGQMKNSLGSTTIILSPDRDATSKYLQESTVRANANIEMVMGVNSSSGIWEYEKEKVRLSLFGADYNKLKIINPINIVTDFNLQTFSGNEMIISEKFKDKYHVNVGDSLNVKVEETSYRFKIVAIAYAEKLFSNEQQSYMALLPNQTIQEITGGRGMYSKIYIKTAPKVDVKTFIEELSVQYKPKNIKVQEAINSADLKTAMNNISIPFLMISILVLIMSIFIIYTSFKVTTLERLPILGTFRSIGATQKMTRNVLLWESMIYGGIGGIIGIPLGIGILSLMLIASSQIAPDESMKIGMSITPMNYIGSFILAFFISLISAYIPIRKASKLPLKDVVLGTIVPKEKAKMAKMIIGVVIFILSLTLPYVVPQNLVGVIGAVCIFTLVTSSLFLVPLLVKVIIFIFEPIYDKIFGNEGLIAIKNMKNNDNINQNICLIILGISTLLTVSILSSTMQTLITSETKGATYDLLTMGEGLDKNLVKKIKNVKGVTKIYPVYQSNYIPIKDTSKTVMEVMGINANEVQDFFEVTMKNNQDPMPYLLQIQNERALIVRDAMLEKYEISVGDTITLQTPKGDKDYKIIGTSIASPTEMMAGVNYIKNDFNLTDYVFAVIKTDDIKASINEIKELYGKNFNYTTSWDEYVATGKKMYGILFGIMQGFAVVLLIIGIFGIINNLIINFIERKASIAIYKSVGMSKKQLRKITLIEALNAGIIGSLFGVVVTLLEIELTKKLMSVLVGKVPIDYPIPLFIIAVVLGLLITLVGSIAPLLKGDKLQIIQAIKYD